MRWPLVAYERHLQHGKIICFFEKNKCLLSLIPVRGTVLVLRQILYARSKSLFFRRCLLSLIPDRGTVLVLR